MVMTILSEEQFKDLMITLVIIAFISMLSWMAWLDKKK